MQYSTIPFNSCAIQAFAQLGQGLDELIDVYLHCTSEPLSKFPHTLNISRNLAEV